MTTSMTVGPAMIMGRLMPSSSAMAGPVTAGSQNVAPQPMSWVSDRAATARTVGERYGIRGSAVEGVTACMMMLGD